MLCLKLMFYVPMVSGCHDTQNLLHKYNHPGKPIRPICMNGLTKPLFLGMLWIFHPAPVRSNGKNGCVQKKWVLLDPIELKKVCAFASWLVQFLHYFSRNQDRYPGYACAAYVKKKGAYGADQTEKVGAFRAKWTVNIVPLELIELGKMGAFRKCGYF